MSSAAELTLAFLEQAPRPAARALQRLPLEQSCAYLESVPARLAGPVVAAMTPWHAARLLERVPAPRAALLLRQLLFADVTSLVRLMREDARQRVFTELPTRYAQRLARSLQYPAHQVGAWIDPGVPTLSERATVDDALRALRTADPASHVFVETEGHEYLGTIAVRDLLRGDSSLRLAELGVARTKPLSNRASLASIAFDSRWDELLHLPVVGRRGNLLGGLSRKTLRRSLHEQRVEPRARARSLVADLAAALVVTCSGVSHLLSGTLDSRVSAPPKSAAHER